MKITSIAAAAALIVAAGSAQAALVDFKMVGTITNATTPGVNVGDTVTVHLFADNGGASLVSQTWNLADLQGFTIQAGSYSATYSAVFPTPATGNFVTDGAGNVSSVQFFGTASSSNNTDNFGSWTGDYVFGNASFCDFNFRCNNISEDTFTDAGRWTVGLAGGVPEPASWALMLMGFGGMGALLRRRRELGVA